MLQLKWEHQFQFAGYYAAQWQGYYKDAGLDVDIRSVSDKSGRILKPIEEIATNKAQFAIGGLDILLAQDNNISVSVLAPIFQRSAGAVFALDETPLNDVSDLASLRIAATPNDTTEAEVRALLLSRGYANKDIQFVAEPPTVKTLIEGKADAIATYEVSALFEAKERNVSLNKLHPADFGISFYGDTLYTSSSFLENNPSITHRFVQASLKGWQYALENPSEIAERISQELPRFFLMYDDPLAYNLEFASHIKELLDYPTTPIGHLNQNKWLAMHERIRAQGLVYSISPAESLFGYLSQNNQAEARPLFLFSLILLTAIGLISWHYKKTILTILSVVALSFLLEQQAEQYIIAEQAEDEKLRLYQKLTSTTAKLEGILRTNLSMITGFAAYISASPDLSEQEFSAYAKEIFKKDPLLINFAAAKDLVINYIYPVEGNEKAIGLDYNTNAAQKEMVLQVVNTGQLLVVGPIDLVQGGVAFIGRAPIYTGDSKQRKLWGIISAPIDAEKLYHRAGIHQIAAEVNLAIKSYDSLGNDGPVFYGNPAIFDDPNKIQSVIAVGGGTWHLALTRRNLSARESTNIFIFRLGVAFSILLLCVMIAFRFRQEKEKLALQLSLAENQNLLEKVGDVAKVGGWKIDQSMRFIRWSSQTSALFEKPLNYKPESLEDIEVFFEPQGFDLLRKCLLNLFEDGKPFDLEFEIHTPENSELWFRVIAGIDPTNPNWLLGTMQDVTDKVKAAQLIRHQATYDSLTGLPNRVLFNDRLSKSIESARRVNNKVAVLFIDLDRFKPVNDNYGHQVGDGLLVEAANRIKQCVRTTDTVSRLSGDEFGVLLVNINKFENAIRVTENINKVLQRPYHINDSDLHISASIGISLFPGDGESSDLLLRKADQAMYEVKRSGRNGWQFYTKEMQQRSEHRHKLLNELINAISNNELIPYLQPINRLTDNQIIKCETLARWIKADGTFVPPYEFITIAEESGLINKIDLAMLKQSAKILIELNREQENLIGMSVNVSPRLFHTKDKALDSWLSTIAELSQQLNLTVEITERLLTDDSEKALNVLNQLKQYGVKIAIDDFGTGYSSLSYLVRFPVDIIKIDRSFVDGIGKKGSAESLIETILSMAEKLDLVVVAEGIETQEQLDFLNNHRCDLGQGFFLAKPMSETDFIDYVEKETVN
ncbi:EAL domain-containing protein [Aliikangiella marina]|uniref:EAL domain-containing protein n=1 Tax=Aliikangiella marina TaxID=1712262 RepID=UPI00163DA7D7|nr:EAL domain-containing protein [Aliikangiella marina]